MKKVLKREKVLQTRKGSPNVKKSLSNMKKFLKLEVVRQVLKKSSNMKKFLKGKKSSSSPTAHTHTHTHTQKFRPIIKIYIFALASKHYGLFL